MCGSGCRRRLCPTVIAVGTGQSHDLPGTRPPARLAFFSFLPLVILSLSFSCILSFLPLSLYIYVYTYILLIAWLLITNRCLDLDSYVYSCTQNCVHEYLLNFLSSPLLLEKIFKFLSILEDEIVMARC